MKIVHINTSDAIGGAARAAFRLHTAMKKQGIESSMLVLSKTRTDDNSIFTVSKLKSYLLLPIIRKIKQYLRPIRCRQERGGFSFPLSGVDVSILPIVRNADIIYLHWITVFLRLEDIEKILQLDKPVYWFLHDMWAMTGGCHYSFECVAYKTHCKRCPNLLNSSSADASFRLFRKKKAIFERYKNLKIITPSNWLADCARSSSLFSHNLVFVIPNTLDITVFKPLNKRIAREILNLPQDKNILLFGADIGVNNPYKGWAYLQESLKLLASKEKSVEVFVFGSNYNEDVEKSIPFHSHFSGHLYDDYTLAILYNAVDVFVSPSLADNFPNTILESLSCGTPVVGFDIGGIPDLILHKKNGYLAEYKNSTDLANGISWALLTTELEQIKVNSRAKVVQICSENIIVQRHLDLIKAKR